MVGMCEQTEVQYLEGDVVWVKLGSCWWPGEVQDITKLPEEVREDLRRDLIAAVKFFDEDKYEYVHKLDHICMYNCRRKMEFIKRGLDMYRTKKKEGSAFMDKFPADVEKAESMTGGDPQILSDSEFAPKEKTTWKTIFCEDKKPVSPTEWFPKPAKMNKNSAVTPEVQSHKPTVRRRITHPRLLRILRGEEADHEVRIRPQPSVNNSASEKSAPYHCPTCDFTSNRLNVIILHNKYHSNMPLANRGRGKGKVSLKADISLGSPAGRGTAKGRMKQSQSNVSTDGSKERDYHSDSEPPIKIVRTKDKVIKMDISPDSSACDKLNERTEPQADKPSEKKMERKPIFGKRKGSKKKEIPPKKKKTNEEIREKLLADWEDDDDDEQEEQEIELLKQVLNKSSKPENTTRAKEMSCFDFDESADSMLDVELEERAKKFAENLRFPRVTEDRDSVQKQKNPEVKQHQSSFAVTREVDTWSQETAEAVDNNESLLHERHHKETVSTEDCESSSILANEDVQEIMTGTHERVSGNGTETEEKPSEVMSFTNTYGENIDHKFLENTGMDVPQNPSSGEDSGIKVKTEDSNELEDLKSEFETVMAETVIPDLPTVPENRLLSERKSLSVSELDEGITESLDGRGDDCDYSTKPDDSPQHEQKNESFLSEQKDYKDESLTLKTEFSETEEEKNLLESNFESETYVEKNELSNLEVVKDHPAESSEKQFKEPNVTDQMCHTSENEDVQNLAANEESSPDKNSVLPVSENSSNMQNFLPTDEREVTSDINTDDQVDSENPEEIPESTEQNELLSLQIKETTDKLESENQGNSGSKVLAGLSEEEISKPVSCPVIDNQVSDVDIVDKVEPDVGKDSSETTEEKFVCDSEKLSLQETDTIDDDDELDINSMPVVMTDAVIKEELDVKDTIKQFSAIQPVVVSAANIDGQLSSASVLVPASAESGSLMTPVSSVKTAHGGNTVLKIIKSSPAQGTNVSGLKSVLPHKPGSKYVIIQQSPGQQVRYPGKPLQQCVTLKTINQQQGNNGSTKKLLIMKTSQSTGSSEVQSVLTTSSKIPTFGQRVITSSGAIVTAVPSGKAVLPKGAKIVPMPQQQLKVFTSTGKQKQIVAPKLAMQSTKAKVSLPSMQSLQKVNVLQTSTGRIVGTTSKSKSSTILIHSPQVTSSVQSKQGIISSSHSTQSVPQVSLKPQLVRGKQIPSPGTSLQRVLLTTGTQSSLQPQQQRPIMTKPSSQQRMLVQRLQVPKSATVVVSTDSIKKTTSGISTGQVPNTSKILPHTQQKGTIQTIHPKGRVLAIQNAKQKLPAKILQPASVSQSLQSVQVLQAAVPAEAAEHPVSGTNILIPSSASSGTTVNIQHSPSSGSILTSEQLAQMMGTSGQIATDSGTLVLVTINESGNLQPFDNSTLVAYDTSAAPDSKAANALYIDSSTLGSQNDLDKLILTINNQAATTSGVVNMEQHSPSVSHDQQCTVFSIANNSQTAAPGACNQDILAAALANTDVFQPESTNVVGDALTINHPGSPGRLLESSSLLTVSSTTLHQAAMLLPSVTTAGLPPAAPGVLETSLTLNQPIMTPLEVPSAVTHLESPPPPPPSTSMQLTQSSLVIPTSAFSSINYAPETAPSTESPVSSSTVMKALPSLQLPVQYVSEEVSESSQMQDKIGDTVVPPSSSAEASQKKDKVLPSFENISEGVTSSEVAGNSCSKYSSLGEAASAQVPEISSPQENTVNFNSIQPEFQQMPESTSETPCCTKKLTDQAVSTSYVTDVKDSSDGIGSSVHITSTPVVFSHQLESTSEAIARKASDTAAAEEEQSPHHEDQSSVNCVESTSENMLMDANVSTHQLAAIEDAESTSGIPEETNSSSTAVIGGHQIVSSVWAESGNNSETAPAKEESER
ncbi:mucin-17-like isoform X1 [Schistocerca americana]|uniref:mucin-17-like isoform X1 n=2 Tax=Schistocerca americana TaxID=7009 RepID=UPI001F4FF3DC|nr:mucin-17-like isoform X1 [Schistocerca americana]